MVSIDKVRRNTYNESKRIALTPLRGISADNSPFIVR